MGLLRRSGFVLRYDARDGVECIRNVTWSNLHKIAAEMEAKMDNASPKHVLVAKLENELRKSEGR